MALVSLIPHPSRRMTQVWTSQEKRLFQDSPVFFHLTHLGSESFFIWIGDRLGYLAELSLSMYNTRVDRPLSSILVSEGLSHQSDMSESLAQKLARKYRCIFFIGMGIQMMDGMDEWLLGELMQLVGERLNKLP